MVNQKRIGGFGPVRKVCRPGNMKQNSSIIKRSIKDAYITSQHYKDGRKDKDKAREVPHIPLEKPINVRGPFPRKCLSKRTLINKGVTTVSKNTIKARDLSRPNNDFSRLSKDKPSSVKEMKWSNAPSLELTNGATGNNTIKSSASALPNNGSSRLNEDPSSLSKNMKKYEASSLGLNNDVMVDAKSIGASSDWHRYKKIENLKSSSSRLNNDSMSLANSIEMPKVNSGVMFATNNPEKFSHCSSSQKNNVISSAKDTEKSWSPLLTNGLLSGKLANPPYVELKDDSSSTSRVMNKNNCCPSTVVMTLGMPKNIVVKDNVLLDNNQGKKTGARNDGFVVSKFSTNNEVSTSKDETMLDKNKCTRVDPSPLEQTMGSQVHQKDLSNALEATAFSFALKGSQIIQNGQHILRNNSSLTREDLSSHQVIEESPKDRINLDSKIQNTSLEDGDITNDDELKRDKRVVSLVENTETHDDNGKEAVSAKKRIKFIDNYDYEEDDGDHWNFLGVGGVRAGGTTSSTIVEDRCTKVSKSFVSESTKLQYYSLLPINEPIWSGVLRIGSYGYFSMAAHLSPKSCKKVWEVSRLLHPVVKLTKLSRLAAFPKGSAALKPSHDNIGLYFLPTEKSPNEEVDQLVKELIENDMVLRAVVKEAEMLILPSILLPEQHKTFKSKHYLWGLFRPREDHVAVVEDHRGAGCHPCDEEMEDVSLQHVVEEGTDVPGLSINCETQFPEQVERQQVQKEPSSSLPEMNAPSRVNAAACPASAPTMAATMPANHVQSNSSSLEAPSGPVFALVAGQTPRLKELIEELKRDGALVVALQGKMIG